MNECNDVESLIDMGIEFQMWGAAKEKAHLPIERFVRGVLSNKVGGPVSQLISAGHVTKWVVR